MKLLRDGRVRPATLPIKKMTKRMMDLGALLFPDDPSVVRPQTRRECKEGLRPCPFVSCKHNLYLDVTSIGSIKLNFPRIDPDEMGDSCALDVADGGGATLEEVGCAMNITRERVRQIEELMSVKLSDSTDARELLDEVTESSEDLQRRELPMPMWE